ncbi:MAG: hypothetical protein LVR00_01665 [Rhabdochlamydiaceae bacterium]
MKYQKDPAPEQAAAIPSSFWDRAQKELPIRISCVVGAYFAIPVFALLGGACQSCLLAHKAWTGVVLPLLKNTQPNNSDEGRFVQPIEQCSEHLLRLCLNIFMYIFRKYTALLFLFPSSVLLLQDKIESYRKEENRQAYIPVFGRLLAAAILNNRPSKNDKDQAKTVFIPLTKGWDLFSQITIQPVSSRVTAIASFLFGGQPEQNTPPAPGSVDTQPSPS